MPYQGTPVPALWAIKTIDARRAREQYLAGFSIRELAEDYRVSYGTMHSVIAGTHRSLGLRGDRDLCRRQGPRGHNSP